MDRGPYRLPGSALPDRSLPPEHALPTVIVMERRPHLEHGSADVEESPRVAIGAPAVVLGARETNWPVLRGGAAGTLLGGLATGAALVSVAALFFGYDTIALVAAIVVLLSIILRFVPDTSRVPVPGAPPAGEGHPAPYRCDPEVEVPSARVARRFLLP